MTKRDWLHLGLSVLGCIPVVGIAANIANAVLYFQEGDALNGILSVAGALIGIGGVTAAIGAAKGICALATVGQAIKTAGVAYIAGSSAMQTIESASRTYTMLKENDFQWNEEILISAGQTALSAVLSVMLNSVAAAQHEQEFLFRGWEVRTKRSEERRVGKECGS